MVDKIAGSSTQIRKLQSSKSARQVEQSPTRSSENSSQKVQDASTVVTLGNVRNDKRQTTELVGKLDKAVSISKKLSETLDSQDSAADSDLDRRVADSVAAEIDKLRQDVDELSSRLRLQTDRARIAEENIFASQARVEDLEKAQAQVQEASSNIQEQPKEALGAHTTLASERVADLLSE